MLTKYYALTDYCAVLIFENSFGHGSSFFFSFLLNVNGNVRFYPAQIFIQETVNDVK